MGATAFQKGLGAVCLISYLVGAIHGLHPGLANATVLPYLLRFNCAATGVPVRKLATAQELPCTAVEAGMAWLLALRQALGIPESLGAAGVLIDEADGVGRCRCGGSDRPTNSLPLTERNLRGLFVECVPGGSGSDGHHWWSAQSGTCEAAVLATARHLGLAVTLPHGGHLSTDPWNGARNGEGGAERGSGASGCVSRRNRIVCPLIECGSANSFALSQTHISTARYGGFASRMERRCAEPLRSDVLAIVL